jgi:hypothetical protein
VFGFVPIPRERKSPVKPLVQRLSLLAACFLLFFAAGCKSSPASLVGVYSVADGGILKEFVRIEKDGDKYLIYEKDGHKWLSPMEAAPVDEDDLEKILAQPVKGSVTGLGTESVAVVQVEKGWKLDKFESKTGFWLASPLGPLELYKN